MGFINPLDILQVGKWIDEYQQDFFFYRPYAELDEGRQTILFVHMSKAQKYLLKRSVASVIFSNNQTI